MKLDMSFFNKDNMRTLALLLTAVASVITAATEFYREFNKQQLKAKAQLENLSQSPKKIEKK